MKDVNILPHKMGSKGSKALAAALGVKRIKKEGSKYRGGAGKIVVNWGNSAGVPHVAGSRIINGFDAVAVATNKLKFFEKLSGHGLIPAFTQDRLVADVWLGQGMTVIARQKLTGSQGDGIVVLNPGDEVVDAPLYTKFIKQRDEFRVHVMGGKVIDYQRKARKKAVPDEEVNWKIRNHQNGFIFQRNDLQQEPRVIGAALRAHELSGLDFGAYDIVVCKRTGGAYVLEVNTAPGLEGTTLQNYKEGFQNFLANPVEERVALKPKIRDKVVY